MIQKMTTVVSVLTMSYVSYEIRITACMVFLTTDLEYTYTSVLNGKHTSLLDPNFRGGEDASLEDQATFYDLEVKGVDPSVASSLSDAPIGDGVYAAHPIAEGDIICNLSGIFVHPNERKKSGNKVFITFSNLKLHSLSSS